MSAKSMSIEAFRDALAQGSFSSIGSYTLVFYMADGEPLCPRCAKQEQARIEEEISDLCDPCWRPVAFDVYWEGPVMQCAHCNGDIESSYGDPDEVAA